jgi:hypothetical protein
MDVDPSQEGWITNDEDDFNQYQELLSEEQWLVIGPMLNAEETRSGKTLQSIFLDICRYTDSVLHDDPAQRDFSDFVFDYIIHANREMERLVLEEGMQNAGGKKGTLLTQEEMEAQRKALFKPVLAPKQPKNPRVNTKQDQKVNKARQQNGA